MTSPLEKAARALCRSYGYDPDANYQPGEEDGVVLSVTVPQPHWRQFVPKARAVILAIREPSDAMVRAMLANTPDGTDPGPSAAAWYAMIDAALSD
jgi:hypothetical protein